MRMTFWMPVTPARVSERCTRGRDACTSSRCSTSSPAFRLMPRIVRVDGPRPHPLPWRGVRGEPSDLANLVVDACHDLRTPLAAAFGFARTIERMGGVTGDNAMYLQQVVEATQELEQLIAALSAVAHGERGTLRLRPQPVDLAELAVEASEGSGHALERDVSAGMIETDPARAVTSLVWLAAPFPEAPATGKERLWRIAAT